MVRCEYHEFCVFVVSKSLDLVCFSVSKSLELVCFWCRLKMVLVSKKMTNIRYAKNSHSVVMVMVFWQWQAEGEGAGGEIGEIEVG